ncbi:MAG TPA: hypothetical protein VES68_00060 [Candidatus Sulfotelmatobacter sp.]|nr:hypothetical protein [Candidatus Sulfotelmatobacter sp.]
MKAKSALISFLLFLFSLFLVKPAFAVTVTITSFPSSISSDAFTINVSVLGASSGTNYIRVDLYKDGSSNYFGETFNGNDWYLGSDGKQYFPITIADSKSTASASIQARIGVPSSSDYDGQGSYKMRIRRYTSSGGQGSEDANNSAVNISINLPTQTPTNSPTSINAPTPQSTNTPTPKSTLTLIPSKTPTPKISKTTSPTNSLNKDVLSESTKSSQKVSENKKNTSGKDKRKTPDNTLIPKILILLGIVILLACAIVISYSYIKNIRNKEFNV